MKQIRQVHKAVRYRVQKGMNESGDKKMEYLSQTDLSFTLIGFVGPILLRPTMFGVPESEDMSGFVHRWRVLGYLHGISDKYNPFHQSNNTLRYTQLMKYFLDNLKITRDTIAEISARCLVPNMFKPPDMFDKMSLVNKNNLKGTNVI